MNVLIYSGPEIIQTSLNHSLTSLKTVLLPHYAIQSVTQHILTTQPWQKSCALLVLPQTRGSFVSVASKHIKDFLEAGGSCLILGSSRATISARSIGGNVGLGSGSSSLSPGGTVEKEATALPLQFFDNQNNRYISIDGDETVKDAVPRHVSLRSSDGIYVKGVYDSTAPATNRFNGVHPNQRTSIVARYASDNDEEEQDGVACLSLNVSGGRLLLWIPNIEYPLEIEKFEILRLELLRRSLGQLGLQLPNEDGKGQTFSRPLPQFLTSTPEKSALVGRVMEALAAPQSGSQLSVFKDANDEFHFHPFHNSFELLELARAKSNSGEKSDPATWQPKHVVVCLDGILPPPKLTPLFDLRLFYEALSAAHETEGSASSAEPWRMGEVLLYGETVTSTQTMLDKNPKLLTKLHAPLLSLATYQLAGRGRGSNIWLSPSGTLQFSILIRVSLSDFPVSKLVFIQYLFSLAAAEACRAESVLGSKAGSRVRLKWPNDIYAVESGSEELDTENVKKIGGVLVSASILGRSLDNVDIVIGCGLNVLNLQPMTSLNQLRGATQTDILSMERTAASVISKFESMWTVFTHGEVSFEPFMDLYLKRWIHSNQLVTLTTTTPHRQVRVVGITKDYGMLRTIPASEWSGTGKLESTVEYVDLQPDGNSFDFMANLIKSKK